MAKEIHLEIVTPRQVVFDGDVQNFTAPGVMGPFEVLYNHAPIVAALQAGKLSYTDMNGTLESLSITGGFLELHKNHATLLADGIEAAK